MDGRELECAMIFCRRIHALWWTMDILCSHKATGKLFHFFVYAETMAKKMNFNVSQMMGEIYKFTNSSHPNYTVLMQYLII